MERYGREHSFPRLEDHAFEQEPIYLMPDIPGAFPEEVNALPDAPPAKIHELPGTTTNNDLERKDGLFRLSTPFD